MAGAGNDFVIFDNRNRGLTDPSRLARAICSRGLSVGADGLILLERSDRADFRMAYFNADGSRGEFCANGTRCLARFAQSNGIIGSEMAIETDAGIVPAQVDGEIVTLTLAGPDRVERTKKIVLAGGPVSGAFMWVGVPHFVIFRDDDLWCVNVEAIGREIRKHPDLQPDGANVNFVRILSTHEIEVRTYERGVEAETLACGSGVVASVSASALAGIVDSPVSVLTRSGVRLNVTVHRDGERVQGLTLSGDARIVFRGTMTADTIAGFDPEWVRNPTSSRAHT